MEEFLVQLKSNRFVRYSTLGGFVLVSYLLGGLLTAVIAGAGLALGRMSYNDHIDDIDL